MSSAAVGTHHHSGAGPLSLMSCVRESSPLQDYELDSEKSVATKKKFWNPKKWFKRKNKEAEHVVPVDSNDKDVLRSRSTSELSIDDEQTRRRSGSSMHPGLSVSHDSVFHSPNSGSDIELDQAQSSSSLTISQPQIDLRLQTELSERLRLRRGRGDTSEDDEGLPRSPCNSPTTIDAPLDKTAIKDLPPKAHSTCSDGSLLSMGSSEMDEESFSQQSRHSSKLSLHEKKTFDQDSDLELEANSPAPLNHSAAHHRVSVRPNKRRAPHRKRGPQLATALPATPEVNEDSSIRSGTPEVASKETVSELSSMSTRATLTETQLKCSSLPPGLVAPGSDNNKLNRSRSNAGSKSQDHFSTLEEDVEKEEKGDKSFFDRIFPRRSAKKRKSKEEKPNKDDKTTTIEKVSREEKIGVIEKITKDEKVIREEKMAISAVNSAVFVREKRDSKPVAAPRSGAASRQRIQPIDLPLASPETIRREFDSAVSPSASPLQVELESRFKLRQSPKISDTPPQSPKSPRNFGTSVIKSEYVSKHSEVKREFRSEEIRVKIPGLSSLQQRVLSLNDDTDNGFKSLSDLPVKVAKPVAKSHSFKSTKPTKFDEVATSGAKADDCDNSIAKAASLDSVKHLDEPKSFLEIEREQEITNNNVESKNESKEYFSEIKNDFSETKNDDNVAASFGDFNEMNSITISGPSHTAVVNVSSNTVDSYVTKSKVEHESGKEVTTKESVSITKIQLKRESTQITQATVTVPKDSVPEFLNRQLNKVETRPASNVVFSMNSPRIIDEQSRPKTVFATAEPIKVHPRKFSQEDIEIVEKAEEEAPKSPLVTVTSMTPTQQPSRFKKNERVKKTSVTSVTPESPKREKPFLRSRSVSLDSLKGEFESCDKSSQDSLDKLDEESEETRKVTSVAESVVLRKKSLIKQRNDEEPELMKVFARRSLKLKDSDSDSLTQQVNSMLSDETGDSKTRNSDKENQADSPKEERKNSKTEKKKEETEPKLREPLVETVKEPAETKYIETTEVTLRKPVNNNMFAYQRTISMIPPKTVEPVELKVKKQASFNDRRKTENWIKNVEHDFERKISQDEIITGISPKSDLINEEFITETKNFNQRKAEWEKRAQEAQKKSVP